MERGCWWRRRARGKGREQRRRRERVGSGWDGGAEAEAGAPWVPSGNCRGASVSQHRALGGGGTDCKVSSSSEVGVPGALVFVETSVSHPPSLSFDSGGGQGRGVTVCLRRKGLWPGPERIGAAPCSGPRDPAGPSRPGTGVWLGSRRGSCSVRSRACAGAEVGREPGVSPGGRCVSAATSAALLPLHTRLGVLGPHWQFQARGRGRAGPPLGPCPSLGFPSSVLTAFGLFPLPPPGLF